MSKGLSGIDRLRKKGVTELARFFIAQRENLKRLISGQINGNLRPRFDESDIVQEVFIRAKKHLASYLKSPQIPPAVWLRILTKQLLAENVRKNMRSKRSPEFEVKESPDQRAVEQLTNSLDSVSESIVRQELQEIVKVYLTRLAEIDREIIEMRHTEAMSFPEISKIAELSLEATKKRYYRALAKLQKLFIANANHEGRITKIR